MNTPTMSTIQPGHHKANVLSARVGESSEKKTPGVFIDFQLEEGGTIRSTIWLSERAYERSLNTLREVFAFNDDFATVNEQLEGRACSVVIELEEDQKEAGKFWPRVKWINAAGAGPKAVAPVENALLARLTNKAKGIARPADAPAPQAKATPRPAPAPIADEDVPF